MQTTVTARLASKPAAAARAKKVKLGGSAFTVAAGKSARVKIKLSRKGLRLLKRRKRISAKVNITVTRVGKPTAKTVKVTLQAPPAALLTPRCPAPPQASHEQALRERAP